MINLFITFMAACTFYVPYPPDGYPDPVYARRSCGWAMEAGHHWVVFDWKQPYTMGPCPEDAKVCTGLIISAYFNFHTCLRFRNPRVEYDGHVSPMIVSETGKAGEPGWEWKARMPDYWPSSLMFKVDTVDVCRAVS